MFFGRNKIGFKFLEDEEHFTMKFLSEGIIDFHETVEGKVKKYPRAGKLDIKVLAETLRETFERELPKILKEIDITDPKYENVEVIVCPKKEAIKKAIEPIEVKKRKITIGKNKIYDMLLSVPMRKLPDYDFQVAFWGSEGEERATYRIDGRYFVLKIDDFTELFNKIIGKLNIQDSG